MSKRNATFEMDACPVCGSFDTDPCCDCTYCERDGGTLEPRRYVAVDSLPRPLQVRVLGFLDGAKA